MSTSVDNYRLHRNPDKSWVFCEGVKKRIVLMTKEIAQAIDRKAKQLDRQLVDHLERESLRNEEE